MIGKLDKEAIVRGVASGVDLNKGKLRVDGWVEVHASNFPGATKHGHAMRSRVIWWLYTGEVIRNFDANIHHKNRDRADDRIKNLEKLDHFKHSTFHNPKQLADRICSECGKHFKILRWRLKDKKKNRGKFCSHFCQFTDATNKRLKRGRYA